MENTLKLQVLTPIGKFVDDDVDEITAPGTEGELGFLPGHTHFLTTLKTGLLTYRKGTQLERIEVGQGYAEIDNNRVIVLVSNAEKAFEEKKDLT